MKGLKFTWKYSLRLLGAICAFVSGYLIIGEWLGNQTVNSDFEPTPNGIKIFVISNGVHTDIVVPTVTDQIDWTEFLDPATFQPVPENDSPPYIAFGWGDRGLYEDVPEWSDLTATIAFRSMLIPTDSAVHVSYFDNQLKETDNSIPIEISAEQYQILIDGFKNSFLLDSEGQPQSLNCCFYPHLKDQFYESPRYYHIFETCNMWTNRLLKDAGVPTARWAPQQENIMVHLRSRDLTN